MNRPLLLLPKVELHCHLLGVITPALLARIRREDDPILVEPETLQAAYPVCHVDSFKRWVEVLKPYQTAPLEVMRPVLKAHAADLIEQNVTYTEIMVSPAMFPRDRPSAFVAAFHRWRQWTFEFEQSRLQIEFIMVVPRTLAPERLESDIATFIELHREGLIVGVALVGVETGESIERFASALHRLREAGLGIEIHAGEHSGPESIWDALEHGRPTRLGHGLSAFQDPSLLDHIYQQQIHMEFCVTSNLCTGAVKDIHQHPIRCAKARGLSFSINTDDPGTFACSLTGEYELVAETFGFDSDDFNTVVRNSLAARFQPTLRYMPS